MPKESGSDINEEMKTLTSHLPVAEGMKSPERCYDLQGSDRSKKKIVAKKVPFYKLFIFADGIDYALMFVGAITAIGNGISFPLMTLIFGEVVDTFGENQDTTGVVHAVSKVCCSVSFILNFVLKIRLEGN